MRCLLCLWMSYDVNPRLPCVSALLYRLCCVVLCCAVFCNGCVVLCCAVQSLVKTLKIKHAHGSASKYESLLRSYKWSKVGRTVTIE